MGLYIWYQSHGSKSGTRGLTIDICIGFWVPEIENYLKQTKLYATFLTEISVLVRLPTQNPLSNSLKLLNLHLPFIHNPFQMKKLPRTESQNGSNSILTLEELVIYTLAV